MVTDHLMRAVVGKVGSGKTWYVVIEAMEALMRGQVVVSNVEFNWPVVESYCRSRGCSVPRENVRYFDTLEVSENPGILLELLCEDSCLVFDEIHLALDARNWKENSARGGAFQDLLTQARKLKIDCWFISQSEANVDSRVIRQCTHIVRCANWLHVPFMGRLFPFPLTLAKTCQADGKTVLTKRWLWRGGKVGKLYNTRQTFKSIALTGKPGAPVRGKKRRQIGYGYTLMAIGAGMFAWDSIRRRSAEEQVPSTVTSMEITDSPSTGKTVVVEQPGKAVSNSPDILDALLELESQLPRYVRARPFSIVLEGGIELRVGSPVADGELVGWMVRAGSILLLLDSEIFPTIRLFPKNGSFPLLTNRIGNALWRRVGGAPRSDSTGHQPGQELHNGNLIKTGPLVESQTYVAPPPFVPEMLETRPAVVPTNKWLPR